MLAIDYSGQSAPAIPVDSVPVIPEQSAPFFKSKIFGKKEKSRSIFDLTFRQHQRHLTSGFVTRVPCKNRGTMAKQPITMSQIRRILQLLKQGESKRKIS